MIANAKIYEQFDFKTTENADFCHYVCKRCGLAIPMMMRGSYSMYEVSPMAQAENMMLDHLLANHLTEINIM